MRRTSANVCIRQRGMVLVVSLVFLLLITTLGVSSMQSATLQEKMASSLSFRNQSFQMAEAVLRAAESTLSSTSIMPACAYCLPPPESTKVTASGIFKGGGASSGLEWTAWGGGFYLIQKLGLTKTPVVMPSVCPGGATVTLYRVTSVSNQGTSRTVLESVYGTC
ncbi:type IV pilus assembly protein PilX [Paucimonas lemoignei]|nr:type IV pilus assembly protein PilX [Paucimonas lemoignei]